MSLYWLYETSKAWLRVRYCFILFSKQKVHINRHFRHNIASYWSIFALPTKLKSQLSCCLSLSNMTNETLFHSCIIQCFRKKWLGEKYSDSFKYNTWFVPYLNQSYWTNHSNKYSSKNHWKISTTVCLRFSCLETCTVQRHVFTNSAKSNCFWTVFSTLLEAF